MKNTRQILKLIKELQGREGVYIVGGWLRDKLLGRQNRDLDIACPGSPLSLARRFSSAARGRFVPLDTRNKIYRVVLKDMPELEYVDFAKMKAPDIVSDLKKRDFTVNSLAVEIKEDGAIDTKNIIDPSSGMADLKKGTIRMTSARSFIEDPLRILRAFRIAAELDFKIEPATMKSAKAFAPLILKSASERARDELVKILANGDSSRWISCLEKTGLLEFLVPEITPMKSSARKYYFHPKGLWQHSQDTLKSLEDIFSGLGDYFPGPYSLIEKHLEEPLSSGMNRKILLKFTALLHDCAKPECARKFGNKTRFLGHEKTGAKKVEKILRRLKMSRKEIAIAKNLTGNHMRPASLSQAGTVTQRASLRLFRDIGDNTPDLLLLSLADWYSYKRLKTHLTGNLKKQQAVLNELVSRYFALKEKKYVPRLIDGNVLMDRLGLTPGPIIGALLKTVNEAQALGKINTGVEALALASQKLTRLAKKYKI